MNNADLANDNFGFYSRDGRHFSSVSFPATDHATPVVNQLLGVNDRNRAVGFYVDSMGNSHGYTYDIGDHHFNPITVPGAVSTTAAAINNRGDIAGFETDDPDGVGATTINGVNDHGDLVGFYTDGAGTTDGMVAFHRR